MPSTYLNVYMDAVSRLVSENSNPSAPTMTIGEVAKATQLTTRAIRFYESASIVSPHRSGRFRLYSQFDVFKLISTKLLRSINADVENIAFLMRKIDGAESHQQAVSIMYGALVDQVEILVVQAEDATNLLQSARKALLDINEPLKRNGTHI